LPLPDPEVFSPRGVYSPTITAFENDETVSLSGTRAFVKFLLSQGVHGLVPLGSSGEPLALVMDERKAVLDAVVEEANGQVPIIAGIVEYSTRAAVEFGTYARSVGCHGLMVMPPYGFRPPKRDVFDHFRRVREAVGLPVMLYTCPARAGLISRRRKFNNWPKREWSNPSNGQPPKPAEFATRNFCAAPPLRYLSGMT
jgi:4-hydroxy-tetrahydrodipicolinate synthase